MSKIRVIVRVRPMNGMEVGKGSFDVVDVDQTN